MNNFGKRVISGLLFVILLTGCIFLHPIAFFALFFIINILGLLEFSRMAKKAEGYIHLPFYLISGSILFIAGFVHNYLGYPQGYGIFIFALLLLCITELYRKKGNSFRNLAFSFLGIAYISLPFTLLIYLPYRVSQEWNAWIVFLPFLFVWINDTFAYLFGVTLGRHKLFPRISPKKSWEGAIGGGIMTIMTAIIFSRYIDLSVFHMIIIAGLTVIFGVYGDLTESMFKRSIDLKDSGDIIPGHGGILDRFDAVLFVIPAFFAYLLFI